MVSEPVAQPPAVEVFPRAIDVDVPDAASGRERKGFAQRFCMDDWKARLKRLLACVIAVSVTVIRVAEAVERVMKLFK